LKTIFCLFILCLLALSAEAQDPFKPYLNNASPVIVRQLDSEVEDHIRLDKLVFFSNVDARDATDSTMIFAVVARPKKPGKYPGLLVLHGGGGNAEIDKVKAWAAKGYVALSIDEPGIANPEKVPFSSGSWKDIPYGKERFTAQPDVRASVLFKGAVAAIQAFYLLQDQPDVIRERIGIVGISWGGYLTTLVSGFMGEQVYASYSVYGSGFYDEGSTFQKQLNEMNEADRKIWLKYLDAGRRAKGIKNPFFIAAAANDNWFYPPAVMKTIKTSKGPVNHVFSPNDSHKIQLPGGTSEKDKIGWTGMEELYFEYYLKGIGKPFPEFGKVSQKIKDEKLMISFNVDGGVINEAKVFYSISEATWPKRTWKEAEVVKDGDDYLVSIPLKDGPIDWFATISDDRPVSVSTHVKHINKN